MKAILALENGTIFEGQSCGSPGEVIGEVVFNTGMAGYQEILTDPSYCGQTVVMTYPHIGNCGINLQDYEARGPFLQGLVVYESSKIFSNWRGQIGLSDFLKRYQIVAIEDVDTRSITKIVRDQGAMNGIISTNDFDEQSLQRKLEGAPAMQGRDLASVVTTKGAYAWQPESNNYEMQVFLSRHEKTRYRLAVLDFGVKWNILRNLYSSGFDPKVFPAGTSVEHLLAFEPDAIFLSNGPGDPEPVVGPIDTIKQLLGKVPMMGICLGCQLLGLALGGKTYKLKFGHHGVNHPVKNLTSGQIEITSQNHGFALDPDSLDDREVEITHVNLNDDTLEGYRHRRFPAFAVQYHPEAGPGPHDSRYLFTEFHTMVKALKQAVPANA